MRRVAFATVVLVSAMAAASTAADDEGPTDRAAIAIGAMLDDFHAAAAAADGARYFAHFAPEGVFLGTDGGERWTLAEFEAFARPLFAKGRGWAYRARDRHVTTSPDGATGWFDEALDNASYGACRGSGVVRLVAGQWKVAQYNLSIPIPNALASELVARIRAADATPVAAVVYVVRAAPTAANERALSRLVRHTRWSAVFAGTEARASVASIAAGAPVVGAGDVGDLVARVSTPAERPVLVWLDPADATGLLEKLGVGESERSARDGSLCVVTRAFGRVVSAPTLRLSD